MEYHQIMLEILELFPLRYPLMIPLLNTVGYFIKHRTRIPNEVIPFTLFAVTSVLSIGLRQLMSGYTGWRFWFDAVFLYGIVNSLKLTLYAIGGYEAVRAIRFTGRREEVKNKMKRGFIRSLIGVAGATLIIALVTVIFGSSFFDIFSHLTDAWAGIIFYAVIVNALWKLAMQKDAITTAYIVMAVSIVLSDIAFLVAASTASKVICFAAIALAAVFGITAAILGYIPYAKERKALKEKMVREFDEKEYLEEWAKLRGKLIGMSPDKQKEILCGFLCFRLQGDSIYGNVDLSSPLFSAKDEQGKEIVLTVNKAKSSGASAESIITAETYISSIVDEANKKEEKASPVEER